MKRSALVWSCCAALLWSACEGGNTPVDPNTPDGGGTTPDGGSPPVQQTITVTGKVLSRAGTTGRTLSVLIPGGGRQPVSVEASGAFSVPGVTVPYELIVADKAQNSAVVYQGLTLASPSLPFDSDLDAAPAHTGYLQGAITGGLSSNDTLVAFVSPQGNRSLQSQSPDRYSLGVDWDGATTTTGTLYAFTSESGGRFLPPKRYVSSGQRNDVTLTANEMRTGLDIAVGPVTNSSLSGEITLPADYVLSLVSVGIVPRPGSEVDLFTDVSHKSTFIYPVPQLTGATYSVHVVTSEDKPSSQDDSGSTTFIKRGLSAGATNVSLSIPAAPRLDQPARDATGVTRSTVFSWSAYASGVHLFQLIQDKSETPTPYLLRIYTREAQTSLPDLSPLGITLPANTQMGWQVNGFGPVASVDAMVALLAQGDPSSQGTGDFSFGVSPLHTFTTAP